MKTEIRLDWSGSVQASVLCRGIVAADPDFFRLFAGDEKILSETLCALAAVSASDYYRPLLAKKDDAMLGFLFAYPLAEMFSRQVQSLRSLVTLSPDLPSLRSGLTELAKSKGHLRSTESFYLTRIYLEPWARGKGIGDLLMEEFQAAGIARGFSSLSLHVRRENSLAQCFYERFGFGYSDKEASGYLSMEKKI